MLYVTRTEWKGWNFEIVETKQTFGKTKLEVTKEDLEEIFYIEEQYLSNDICEELYAKYLYIYDN